MISGMMRNSKLVAFWFSGFALLMASSVFGQVREIVVSAKPLGAFDLTDKSRTRFGALEYVGGLAMRSQARNFGAFSGLRIREKGQFTAITDTGFWVSGKFIRSADGAPASLSDVQIAPLLDEVGQRFKDKWQADAESLTFHGQSAFVGTEQDTRILRFAAAASPLESRSIRITPHFPEGEFGYNNGFEALATFPKGHVFEGGLLALRENARKEDPPGSPIPGHIFYLDQWLSISVVSSNNYRITDADFLPGGDLLILERLFSMSRGANIRIRRIKGDDIKPDALLAGEIIFQAGPDQQVDNMEGLSVFTASDGSVRIGMVSDNNHWLLQRNLYLEFKLIQ